MNTLEKYENIAYGLGKRGHRINVSGLPMEDAVFREWVESEDVPIVLAVMHYIRGFNDRRDQYKVKLTLVK